jgi:DNA-binding MarR family transcriptional regulator
MKHFNMQHPSSKAHGENAGLCTGPDGRLFDARVRGMLAGGQLGRTNSEASEAVAAVRIAGKAMRHQMDRFADHHGLSEGRLFVLFQLGRAPEHQLPLGEIAEHLDVSPRNVTGLIDHLEKDGLVERVPDTTDRRSIQARLTPSGLKTVVELWQKAHDEQLAMVADFSHEELAQLRHLCLRLVEKLAGKPAVAERSKA